MQKELLKPDTLTKLLKEHLRELKKCLETKQKAQISAPPGHLRIALRSSTRAPQYFHITKRNEIKGTYIPHTQLPFIKKLAQKDYDFKLIKLLKAQISSLEKYIERSDRKIEDLYDSLNKTRQSLITPATLTNAQYIEEWQNISWSGHPFAEATPEYITARNERVRSKSEVIIADTLNRMGIPYRYEYPVELSGKSFHPDFLCLNLRTRQEFIWEHFGMMDNPEYLEKTVQKIKVYNDNNYFIGKNLIITMETQSTPINIHQLQKIISAYLGSLTPTATTFVSILTM